MNSVTEPLVRLAARVDAIQPFYVMELAKEAALLEREGRDIIHMGIGEPDFTAPEPVIEAAASALRRGVTQYTNALGCTRCARRLPATMRRPMASASIRRASWSPPALRLRCCSRARRWSTVTMKC
jgi:hypothetical protein